MPADAVARRGARRLSRSIRAQSTTAVPHTAGAGAQQILANLTITGLKVGDVVDVDAAFTAAANNANTKACYIYLGATNAGGGTHLAKNAGLAGATGAHATARFMVISATEIVYIANDLSQQRKTVNLTTGVTVSLEMFLAAADSAALAGYSVRVANP